MCSYCSVPGLLQFSLPWCSCLCTLLFHCCINVDTFHSFVFSSPITCTSHTHQLLNCSLNIDANDLTGTLPTEFVNLKSWDLFPIVSISKLLMCAFIILFLVHWTCFCIDALVCVRYHSIVVFMLIDSVHSSMLCSPITHRFNTHQLLQCSSNIAYNDLTGTLPTEFGELKELKVFYIGK